jgi:hypothetical protein
MATRSSFNLQVFPSNSAEKLCFFREMSFWRKIGREAPTTQSDEESVVGEGKIVTMGQTGISETVLGGRLSF